jgi:bacterioferritin-associated ferredoxin
MHRTKKEQEIIEGLKPVCICKGIKARVFQERIKAGLTTVEELKKATGAGCGSCKGERCTARIRELLVKHGQSGDFLPRIGKDQKGISRRDRCQK